MQITIGGISFNIAPSELSLSTFTKIGSVDIGKLTAKEARVLEKKFYKIAKSRLDTMYKKGYYSSAAEAYFGDRYPQAPSKDASIYSLKHRVTALREFLGAKTSTYEGTKKVLSAEEKRLFGKSDMRFQSEEERVRFWKAYMEFMHQNPIFYDQSTRVQQFIGRETFWRNREFTASDLDRILKGMLNESTGGVDIRADAGYNPEI